MLLIILVLEISEKPGQFFFFTYFHLLFQLMENSAVGQDGELVQINVVMAHKLDQELVIIRLLPMEGMIAKEIRKKVELVN